MTVDQPESAEPLDLTALARAYVERSNAHDLAQILPLFDEDADYHSDRVGDFSGRAAIGRMMAGFFTRVPDVHWAVDSYAPIADDGIVFDFAMSATDGETGEPLRIAGTERIFFNASGLIRRIEVVA